MIYSFDYDKTYFPAMPVVEIVVTSEQNIDGILLKAVVDSGADATIMPIQYLRSLQARKGETAWLRGTAQKRIRVDCYWVTLRIGSHLPMYIQVVGDAQGEEIILGRDVLNHLIVTLNGLAEVTEISD